MTASMNLTASRNIAWAPTIELFYPGADLPISGASVDMDVRLYPGAPGEPVARAAAIQFQDLPPTTAGAQRSLRLYPTIPQAALRDFPTGLNKPEPGEADTFSYDIVVTYADGQQDKLALGSFFLEPGVTRA